MAKACFNGCAAQYRGLVRASRGCLTALKPLVHGFDAYQDHAPAAAACAEEEKEFTSGEVPPVLPALLTSSAEAFPQSPSRRAQLVEQCGDAPGEYSTLTTATASGAASPHAASPHAASPHAASPVASPHVASPCGTPAHLAGKGLPWECCTAGAKSRPRNEEVCVADASTQLGEAAASVWHGAWEFSSFMGRQLLHAADVAKPHVVSLANSAVETLKSSVEKKTALPKPTGSTWEANSRAADSRASRPAVAPLDLSDYDVCSESGFTSCRTTCPPSRPFERTVPAVSGAPLSGYDPSRDAQLRYALTDSASMGQQAVFQTQLPQQLLTAQSFGSFALPQAQSFNTVFPQAQSFPVLHTHSFDLTTGSGVTHQAYHHLPQAKILRTTLGERRPFSGKRAPLVSRPEAASEP